MSLKFCVFLFCFVFCFLFVFFLFFFFCFFFSVFSYGGHFVQRSETILAILV